MSMFSKDLKTNVAGLAAIAVTVVYLVGKMDTTAYLGALGLIVGGGFMAAKDSGK
jgi:hypothetical protein